MVTTQPADLAVIAGATASFSAAASGTPSPSVQWQSSLDGSLWTNIPGATYTDYTFTAQLGDNAILYRAVFSNSAGTVTTNAARLTVTPAASVPVITTHPADLSVTAGATALFSADASGYPAPSIQWQSSPDGSSWTDVVGAASTSYSFVAQLSDNAKQYRAVFSNSAGSATTKPALLIVAAPDTPPVILTHPVDQTVVAGDIATFSASASGIPTPTVQWQMSSDGSFWTDIMGATSPSYSFTAQLNADSSQFRAVFSNVAGSVLTDTAVLTVNSGKYSSRDSHPSCRSDSSRWRNCLLQCLCQRYPISRGAVAGQRGRQ